MLAAAKRRTRFCACTLALSERDGGVVCTQVLDRAAISPAGDDV